MIRAVLFVSVLSLAACGGDDGGSNVTLIDSGSGSGSGSGDAATAECLLPASLGTVTPAQQEAHSAIRAENGTAVDNYYLYAPLDTDTAPDVVLIDLYAGYGAFASGFPTGSTSVTLTGEEAAYDTCGACVMAQTDYTQSGPTGDPYFANGGTLNITSLSATSMAGTLTNVTFQHVTIDEETLATTPLNDGCTGTLASLAFSATPEPEAQNVARTTGVPRRWKLRIAR